MIKKIYEEDSNEDLLIQNNGKKFRKVINYESIKKRSIEFRLLITNKIYELICEFV